MIFRGFKYIFEKLLTCLCWKGCNFQKLLWSGRTLQPFEHSISDLKPKTFETWRFWGWIRSIQWIPGSFPGTGTLSPGTTSSSLSSRGTKKGVKGGIWYCFLCGRETENSLKCLKFEINNFDSCGLISSFSVFVAALSPLSVVWTCYKARVFEQPADHGPFKQFLFKRSVLSPEVSADPYLKRALPITEPNSRSILGFFTHHSTASFLSDIGWFRISTKLRLCFQQLPAVARCQVLGVLGLDV